MVLSPCCSRDFEECSPAPQYGGINSLAFFLVYLPALTTTYDDWEDHSLDYMDLCWHINACFSTHCLGLSLLSFQNTCLLISWLQSLSAWFWSPGGGKLSLLLPFPLLFASSNGARCHSVQYSSVAISCPTLCNPMDCSTPGSPVLHCLPEFTQVPVHRVGDAIQLSHPLSPSSPSALNFSQH